MITPEGLQTNISARRIHKIVVSGAPQIQNFNHTYQKINIPADSHNNKGFEESTYSNTPRSICASKGAVERRSTEVRDRPAAPRRIERRHQNELAPFNSATNISSAQQACRTEFFQVGNETDVQGRHVQHISATLNPMFESLGFKVCMADYEFGQHRTRALQNDEVPKKLIPDLVIVEDAQHYIRIVDGRFGLATRTSKRSWPHD